MRIRIVPLLFAILLAAPALTAQEGDFTDVRERAGQLRDTVALRRLEESHRARSSAADEVAAGFAALRLWEVTGDRQHAGRARRYFDRAVERAPDNAWAHYGHALSFAPDIELKPGTVAVDDVLGRVLGMNAVSRARRALERALALDPELPGAAALLAEYAVSTWDEGALRQAHETLRASAARPDAPGEVLLALARTELERGDAEAAAAVATLLATRHDRHYAAAQLALAAALATLPGHAEEAGSSYFAALEAGDSVLLARLWQDAALIARDAEEGVWAQALTASAKRRVLRSFWEVRGALASQAAEQRVAEHYARLHHASQNHRRWGQLGAAPGNALVLGRIDPRFTDQGVIFVRHGRPDHVYLWPRTEYVIWYYRGEDGGPLSYHFKAHGEPGYSRDAILIRQLPCLPHDAALYDPRLRPLTYGCNNMRTTSVSATIRRDQLAALRSDSHDPNYTRELPFHFDLYTFRADGGETEVVAAVGVSRASLPAAADELRISLAVIDTARFLTSRTALDVPVPRAPAPLQLHLRTTAAPALAAAYRIDAHTSDGQIGQTYGGTLAVRSYRTSGVSVSDIVLAAPDVDGAFVRGPHRLRLVPSQVFPGGRFRIFYELYDVPAGAEYRTQVRIERERSGVGRLFRRDAGVSLQFAEQAPDQPVTTLHQLRDVTAPVEPGTYTLRVRITSPEWRGAIERERRFTVPAR